MEVRRRSELLASFSSEFLPLAERIDFHMVLIGETGTGMHEVDFVETEIAPRRLAHIAPGMVHRWRADEDFEAILVLCPDAPIGLSPTWRFGSSTLELRDEQWTALHQLLDVHQELQHSLVDGPARAMALRSIRDLLFVTLGLHHSDGDPESSLPAPYVAFRNDLEDHLTVTSSTEDRANRIGYSPRTITRACQRVAGQTPKQLVDDRIGLEAQRRLSQPGATSSAVAAFLGFTEPTNFAKFFRRVTGESPTAWIESR